MWKSQKTVEAHKRIKKIKISGKTLHEEVSYGKSLGTQWLIIHPKQVLGCLQIFVYPLPYTSSWLRA
jgi:hypothetical protein